jgi:hypothetical protein
MIVQRGPAKGWRAPSTSISRAPMPCEAPCASTTANWWCSRGCWRADPIYCCGSTASSGSMASAGAATRCGRCCAAVCASQETGACWIASPPVFRADPFPFPPIPTLRNRSPRFLESYGPRAIVTGATFIGAIVTGAIFTVAIVTGAIVTGAYCGFGSTGAFLEANLAMETERLLVNGLGLLRRLRPAGDGDADFVSKLHTAALEPCRAGCGRGSWGA